MTPQHRRALALDALTGLATGDAFGNQAFTRYRVRAPGYPPETWAWTDDTQMACSLVDVIDRHGKVDQGELAGLWAERAEERRDYGMGALRFLARIREDGADWRQASTELFDGVGSWGNGGAMRVAPVGAYFADDLARAATEAAASAEVTHAHPEGVAGGIAAGVAAGYAAAVRGQEVARPAVELFEAVLAHVPASEVRRGLERARQLLDRPAKAAGEVARELGNGSQISAQDTVPFTLWVAATCLDDYEAAIRTCVAAGGDMDTTCAIVGGIVAAHHGAGCIPADWLAAREPLPSWLALAHP